MLELNKKSSNICCNSFVVWEHRLPILKSNSNFNRFAMREDKHGQNHVLQPLSKTFFTYQRIGMIPDLYRSTLATITGTWLDFGFAKIVGFLEWILSFHCS
jgi:hypothetical protein